VLFVRPPTAELLQRYRHARAIGIAGNSRTMSPEQMEASLPAAFASLAIQGPKIVHYKVCSTFDSSPQIGSIGRAIDIGHRVFQNRFVPLVVGAPVLQRLCVFGNLFARSGLDSAPYRLDRHPTMRHHPVTPMTEADLRVHLLSQTDRPMALVDVLALDRGDAAVAEQLAIATQHKNAVVLFDTLTDDHLATIGRVIWDTAEQEQQPLFVAGSSGVEYALTQHWHAARVVAPHRPAVKPASPPRPVQRTVIVSGSCSPVTERQIAWAMAHGFAEVPIETARLLAAGQADTEISAIAKRVEAAHDEGLSVIAHTSRGPQDDRIANTRRTLSEMHVVTEQLGTALGTILRKALQECNLQRVAVTGGDTSGHVARTLGIDALEMVGPLEPGAPLCLAHSGNAEVEGIEITFKGGQVGHDDFFKTLLRGGPSS
jgi:3-oxoisoapionate kinase